MKKTQTQPKRTRRTVYRIMRAGACVDTFYTESAAARVAWLFKDRGDTVKRGWIYETGEG